MERKNFGIKRALGLVGIACAIVFSSAVLVFGVQGAGIFIGRSSGLNYSFDGTGTQLAVQPGNMTFLDVDGGAVTTHWAGFYGNISGNLSLEDANGKVFYDWSGIGTAAGEIYASNVSTVIWGSVNCTNSSQISAIESFLNVTGSDMDSLEYTYSGNSHPQFSVAGRAILANSCNSTNMFSDGVKNESLFSQILMADSNDCPVFTTLINSSSTGFDGTPVDFELLAGVRRSTLTNLYFFIELG
jgi:hypothetical protein